MKNSDKTELKRIIIEDIPEERIKFWTLHGLWRRYAPHVAYSTFLRYFKVFRLKNQEKKNG